MYIQVLIPASSARDLGYMYRTTPSDQIKARCASKPLQSSCQFSVVPVCSSAGFGLTLNGGREAARNAPLAVRRLLKGWAGTVLWSPARESEGTLYINGESSLGLTHAQVLEWIHTGGPGSTSCYAGLFETHPSKSERARAGGPRKGDSGFPRGEGSGICEE